MFHTINYVKNILYLSVIRNLFRWKHLTEQWQTTLILKVINKIKLLFSNKMYFNFDFIYYSTAK